MPLKRSQSQYNGLNFWQCICSGTIKLIRQARNGESATSDPGVLRGGWNSLACGLFILQICKMLIYIVCASGVILDLGFLCGWMKYSGR